MARQTLSTRRRATGACVRHVRVLDVSPDPLAIAQALGGRPGLAVLASHPDAAPRAADARTSFVTCDPVDTSDALVPPCAALDAAPDGAAPDGAHDPRPLWIGVVPYEGLRALERPGWTRQPDERPQRVMTRPAWRRYAAVVRVDHVTGEVVAIGDSPGSVEHLARLAGRARAATAYAPAGLEVHVARDDEDQDRAHLERIRHALHLIAAGDLYEVNLARRIAVAVKGDALTLFMSLFAAAPAPWGFLQDLGEALVIASSPELALSVRGDRLRTCPIKGTRPRGRDADDDERLARELEGDSKEQAELTMAIDVHRNDLGRVAVPGSVRVLGPPRVLGGRTVWSRVAEIEARRAAGASLQDVVRAVLPCGSVTGAPKSRAMEVIARLEPWRRGLYTGAFGYVGHGGGLELAVAIRTLQLTRTGVGTWQGSYFAGGGIVADSVPERELEETRWKAVQLGRLGRP